MMVKHIGLELINGSQAIVTKKGIAMEHTEKFIEMIEKALGFKLYVYQREILKANNKLGENLHRIDDINNCTIVRKLSKNKGKKETK